MRIVTHHDPKPVPTRAFDWSAVDDQTYGGEETDPIGWGATEQEAIDDLLAQMEAADGTDVLPALRMG